jgi:trans-aconitate methyltransferase
MTSVGRPEVIRLSFNEAVEIYDEVPPSYPAALFDELFDLLSTEPEIVEVGPGTGQTTKDLLARDASVHAVEISPAMAAKLRTKLPSNRLRISVGEIKEVVIASGADAVFSATAYQWISRAAQTDRLATILRPGGVVAIVDLIQVDSPDDLGFFAAAQPIYDRYGDGRTGPPSPTRNSVDPVIRSVLQADNRFAEFASSTKGQNRAF